MVHLYVFRPADKLRFLSRLLNRGSKRLLRSINATSTPSARPNASKISCILDNIHLHPAPREERQAIRDTNFYKDDSDAGFCIFRVENTLFKVHRCFLMREPSAFGDMFSLPNCANCNEGSTDDTSIFLSDSVEQFRDLLWALYALPSDLCVGLESQGSPSIQRLANIAELANKYCFASFESWALERIYLLSQDPTGFLRNGTPEICARVLKVAVLCNHKNLLEIVTHHLISRILWCNMRPDAILPLAKRYGLRTLLGVSLYRELIDMEQASYDGIITTQPVFPPSIDIEKRMQMLAAHHSLVSLWERLRTTPPSFSSHTCPMHAGCVNSWRRCWLDAGIANQTLRSGSADVLGGLKSMMIYLRKTMTEAPSMSIQCMLAALEVVAMSRDLVIEELLDHFTEYQPSQRTT